DMEIAIGVGQGGGDEKAALGHGGALVSCLSWLRLTGDFKSDGLAAPAGPTGARFRRYCALVADCAICAELDPHHGRAAGMGETL
ncbi:MAG: hypothetical protein Q7T39_14100, partial [Polaromonas sp.]|nr:hypothetical protein [Polaromonas sp.]